MKQVCRSAAIAFAIALTVLLASPANAQITPYSQDFEALDQTSPTALGDDGWLGFANVFSPDGTIYFYGYGVFPAPNGGPGFSGIDIGQGGPDQGDQQLVIYNDYNNSDHQVGNLIEANVFQERIVDVSNVGQTWVFSYDAKRGNINDPNDPTCPCNSVAIAFIKTLDPNAGFALTNFEVVDMTDVPDAWGSYALSLEIDASLVGQIFQVGFATTTSFYNPSGVFYDNVKLAEEIPLDCEVGPGNGDATINLNGCDTGISNRTLDSGCTMNDAIYECGLNAEHHGQFVECVSDVTNEWKLLGLISGADKGRIMRCAAMSMHVQRQYILRSIEAVDSNNVDAQWGSSSPSLQDRSRRARGGR